MNPRRLRQFRQQVPDSPSGAVRLRHRALLVLPTALGASFGMLLVAMLLAAMNYASSMGHALTFLLAGVALGATVHGHRNLLGLRIEPLGAAPVFAGNPAAFRFRLCNDHRYARYELRLSMGGHSCAVVDLAGGEHKELSVPVATERRGLLRAPCVVVQSQHPGHLLCAWSRLALPLTVTVYPRPLASETAALPDTAGEAHAAARHEGEGDFDGLRDFSPGDSPRRIDWKAYARGADLQVKQFAARSAPEQWLCFERTEGTIEERLSRLCHQALEAQRCGRRFGLQLGQETLSPAAGQGQLERVLHALAMYPERSDG